MTPPIALRLTEAQESAIRAHLFPGDGLESVVLALCGAFPMPDGTGFCVHELVPIPHEQCTIRSESAVRWPVACAIPLLDRAAGRGLMLLKIHSHPDGVEDFSGQDDESDHLLSGALRHLVDTDVTHLSAIALNTGVLKVRAVGRDGALRDFSRVVRVGDRIEPNVLAGRGESDEAHASARQAFGDGTYQALHDLRVGVVGCSGTGSWVVEMLARLGVGSLVLVDPDIIERRNLNRIVNSTSTDVSGKRSKAARLQEAIFAMGLGTTVEILQEDLASQRVVRTLAACDVLFGCVDSADGRDLLNHIATFYLIPLIDLGVRIDADGAGGVERICGAIHFLLPGGSSLLSRGVITAEQVQADAMRRHDPEGYAARVREGYVKGSKVDRPAVISLNGFIASHAVNELLARVHGFRRDGADEFRYQVFDLREGTWQRLEDGPACAVLGRFIGRGETTPLLQKPELS